MMEKENLLKKLKNIFKEKSMIEFISLEKRKNKLTLGEGEINETEYNQTVLIMLLWGAILNLICLLFLPDVFSFLDDDLLDTIALCLVASLFLGILFMLSSGVIMNIIGFSIDSISIGCFFSLIASQILHKAIIVVVIEVIINILIIIFFEKVMVLCQDLAQIKMRSSAS